MKYFVFVLLFLIGFCHVYSQDSTNTNKLEFNSSITIDNVSNLSGGIKSGNNTLALLDLSAYYHINHGFLKNTSIHAHLLKTTGPAPSQNLIGDIQTASNIEGRSYNFIYELLFSYNYKKFNVTFGLHDMNSEFIVSDVASNYINSSFGIFPVVSLNFPTSIFPMTTFGVVSSYKTNNYDIVGGFYNLNYEFVEPESFRVENHFYQKGFFVIGEFRYRWIKNANKIAEIKTGGFFKKGNHENDLASPTECVSEQNYGFYVLSDIRLKQISSNKVLYSFVQIGHAPTKINLSSEYYGFGISLLSENSKYFPQHLGIAVAHVKLNDLLGDKFINSSRHETTLEFTSEIELFNHFVLQPDFQYIISPSGGLYENSFTAIMRLIINFSK